MRHLRLSPGVARAGARLSPLLARLGLGEATDPAWIDNAGVPMLASSEKARQLLGWRPRYPTAVEVMRHFAEVAPGRMDPRIAVFLRAADLVARRSPPMPELSGFTSRVHLSLLGPGGGDVGIDVRGGRMRIEKAPPRPPTAAVTLTADLLLDLLAGRADFGSAQLTGKIRVDGEGHAAMLVGGMVAMFRSAGRTSGPGGLIGKALLRYLSGGRVVQPQDQ
jgi:putative sterol carrier protein